MAYLSSIGTVFVTGFRTNSITATPRALRNPKRLGNRIHCDVASARNQYRFLTMGFTGPYASKPSLTALHDPGRAI